MIISATPFRISFFGGGTDFPSWYKEHSGAVLSTTINKYCYLTCRYLPPFFEHNHRIVYSIIETVKDVHEIKHPAVKAVLREMNIDRGLEIHHDADLPARSGIGSSSSFTVGLLNALYAMRGERKSKNDLAREAIHIEQNVIRETVGSQDQIAAAYGGLNRVDFLKSGDFVVSPVIAPPSRLQMLNNNLMLFFTGFSRIAETVESTKVSNFKNKENELKSLTQMVDDAQNILQNPNRDLNDFGKMLKDAWLLKRGLSDKVSNSDIDEIFEIGMANGALGGKILGAGGGGFILFYVPSESQDRVRTAFSKLIEVDFQFENKGSQIVLYDPDLAVYRGWNPRDSEKRPAQLHQ